MTRSGRCQVVEGELFFEQAGAGDDVVLLHGFGLDLRMWQPQFTEFQSTYRVIRYDMRGFGRSSLPGASRHAHESAASYGHEDDLKTLLQHLGAERAHVVGLSMGGRMALRFAAAYPAVTRSLVLADPALDGYTWSQDWQSRWKAICDAAKADYIDEAKRLYLAHPLFDPAREKPQCEELLRTMVSEYSGWHWKSADTASVPTPPLAQRLGEITVPALVITGSRDLADFQSIADILVKGLPCVQRESIAGSGHMVNLENPEAFNEILLAFWNRR
jgi:3-oxoadipate enol-lactonase